MGTLSPSAGNAMPVPGRGNRHRLATTTAPISRLKTTQNNIKAKVGTLSAHKTVNTGGGSMVQRFDAGAKDDGNHSLCLHRADLMGMGTTER